MLENGRIRFALKHNKLWQVTDYVDYIEARKIWDFDYNDKWIENMKFLSHTEIKYDENFIAIDYVIPDDISTKFLKHLHRFIAKKIGSVTVQMKSLGKYIDSNSSTVKVQTSCCLCNMQDDVVDLIKASKVLEAFIHAT